MSWRRTKWLLSILGRCSAPLRPPHVRSLFAVKKNLRVSTGDSTHFARLSPTNILFFSYDITPSCKNDIIGSQCKCFAFCGREHQAAFWKLGHKKECAELKDMRESGRKSVKDIRSLTFAAIQLKGEDASANGGEFMPPGAWAAISSQGCSCGGGGGSCCGAGGDGDPMALYRQVRRRCRCDRYTMWSFSLR